MIRIVKKDINFNFVSKFKFFTVLSASLVLLSWVLVAVLGLNFGIDFKGGTNIIYHFEKTPEVNKVRKILKGAGIKAVVSSVGNDISVQIDQSISLLNKKEMNEIKKYLYDKYKNKNIKTVKVYQNRIRLTFSGMQNADEILKTAKAYKDIFKGDKEKFKITGIKHFGADEKSNAKLNVHKYDIYFESLSDYVTEILEEKTGAKVSRDELKTFKSTMENKLKSLGVIKIEQDSVYKSKFIISFNKDNSSKDIEKALAGGKYLFTIERIGAESDGKTFDYSVKVSKMKIASLEQVGPKVGAKLKQDGTLAMIYALIAIFIYVAFRFDGKFSPGAVIALFHDVSITLGVFAVTRMEFNLPVVAALLTLIGYSLNDTIVIFDKVREVAENAKLNKKNPMTIEDMVNKALNSTLSRTLLTSLTTLGVVVSMLVFGGAGLRPFSVALLVGIFVGTYSSLFIATPLYVYLAHREEKKLSQLEETEAEA